MARISETLNRFFACAQTFSGRAPETSRQRSRGQTGTIEIRRSSQRNRMLRFALRRHVFCVCTMRFPAYTSAWKMDSESSEKSGSRIRRSKNKPDIQPIGMSMAAPVLTTRQRLRAHGFERDALPSKVQSSEVLPEPPRRPCPCWDERAVARPWDRLFCFLRGGELRSLNCAFSFETSSRSAASSFCTPADPGSSFDSLAGADADGRGVEKGIQGRKRLAVDDAAAGRMEVK